MVIIIYIIILKKINETPTKKFLVDKYILYDFRPFIIKDFLYELFNDWCNINNQKCISKHKFYIEIKELVSEYEKKFTMSDKRRITGLLIPTEKEHID